MAYVHGLVRLWWFRAFMKFTAGVHLVERAGVDIYDLGGYTSKRTVNALCVSEIGSCASRTSWQDA